MQDPHASVFVIVHPDQPPTFDADRSTTQGFTVSPNGDVVRRQDLPDHGVAVIEFDFHSSSAGEDFTVVGIRLARDRARLPDQPPTRNTGDAFFGETPFRVSWTESKPHTLRLVESRRDHVLLGEGWHYELSVQTADGETRRIDPRIYNDGEDPPPFS